MRHRPSASRRPRCPSAVTAAVCAMMTVLAAGSAAAAAPTVVTVDTAVGRRPISPLIYGLSYATTAQLRDLNVPLNRSGGDSASTYNWRINARNAGKDWFFESLACGDDIFDQHGDGFVALSKAGGAQSMLTVPMLGWVAKLGDGRQRLSSFSIGKYGFQERADLDGLVDAGNGHHLDGTLITDNDPADAQQPAGVEDQRQWLRHLLERWGGADKGGVRYYLMDNEPSFWHDIHRDVHPQGAHASEVARKVLDYAAMVKAVDPAAQVVAPEEWGWNAYFHSGFDQQYSVTHGYGDPPDRRDETGGMDYLPWLLSRWKAAGHPVDVVSIHFYPQGKVYTEGGGDRSPAGQVLRNRSTRDLWDPDYVDPTWIKDKIALIPRLRKWVDSYYYPGTPIALTEYNWGGEDTMNGATAQADVLGIFGREGLDLATRWATPATDGPTYLAIKLYRNYDGHKSTFGETSVAARVVDPDHLAAFAAVRADGALTVMVINKDLSGETPVTVHLDHFAPVGTVDAYQLVEGTLRTLPPGRYSDGALTTTVPAPSVTLFVLRAGKV